MQRIELENPQAYQDKLIALLGHRSPFDVLAATPSALSGIVLAHPPEVLRTRPFPGKWTPNEIIGHLVDTEWVFGFRIRLILCEPSPVILGMDQERWVEAQRHNEREPAELLSTFTDLRRANLATWRRMRPADLSRVGQHNERGAESLDLMLKMEAGHDLSHLDQLARYLAAIKG